jgi:hypothetical protein
MSERAWTLPAAAGLAALEATALIAVIAFAGGRAAPLFVVLLATKFPFCLALLRRLHGAWFGLLLWELGGMLAALTAPRTPLPLRLLELAAAGTVATLLFLAMPLFPDVRLPPHDQPQR